MKIISRRGKAVKEAKLRVEERRQVKDLNLLAADEDRIHRLFEIIRQQLQLLRTRS